MTFFNALYGSNKIDLPSTQEDMIIKNLKLLKEILIIIGYHIRESYMN